MLNAGRSGSNSSSSNTTEDPESSGDEHALGNELFIDNPDDLRELHPGDNIQHAAAYFLLKMKEERKITQTAVDGIVQDITDLWDGSLKQVCLPYVTRNISKIDQQVLLIILSMMLVTMKMEDCSVTFLYVCVLMFQFAVSHKNY